MPIDYNQGLGASPVSTGDKQMIIRNIGRLFAALAIGFFAMYANAANDASCDSESNLEGNRSYKVSLPTHDGQVVAFNILEPSNFDCANRSNGAHPLMLHGPGFGGSGATSGFANYRDLGYTIISWDPRGFGGSSGTVRTMDPEFEGQYLVQILDWAENNLDYLAWKDEVTNAFVARPQSKTSVAGGVNLVVGAQGGSYGGGFQLLLLTTDHKKRLDAIAPDITWHDLRYSLNPGDTVKTLWDLALTALGEVGGSASMGGLTNDGMDPYVKETLARGAATNEFPREALDWFHYRGMGYWCAANGLPAMPYPKYLPDAVPLVDVVNSYNVPDRNEDGSLAIGDYLVAAPSPASYLEGLDVLLTQGMIDTLFNFNEAWWNRQCLSAAGANVSLYTHNGGHAFSGIQAGQFPANSGGCTYNRLDWFESRLRPDALPLVLDETCFALGTSGDTVSLNADKVLAPGGSGNFTVREVPALTVVANGLTGIANTTGNAPFVAELGTMEAEGILAGIPQVNFTVASVTGINEMVQDCANPALPTRTGCDSIIFVGVGKRNGGIIYSLIDDQVTPLRGLGEHNVSLVGIAERVAEGTDLALLFYASHPQFFSSTSRDVTIPAVRVTGTVGLPLYAVDDEGKPDTTTPTGLSGEDAPIDSDGDGVDDRIDQCSNSPTGEPVDLNGCSASQRDTDGDGVNDAADQCPGTAAGMEVDPNGCDLHEAPLSVALDATPTSGDVTNGPLTVNFTATIENTDQEGSSPRYVFYFGDGSNSGEISESVISHDYDKAGSYEARVVVVDENSNSAEDTITINTTTTVTVEEDPVLVNAVLSVELSNSRAPVRAMFDASGSSAPEGASYRFVFGDGEFQEGTEKFATHSYALAGEYTVTLIVTASNDANNSDSTTAVISVGSGQQTTVQLVVTPTTASIGELIRFDASASIAAEGTSITSYHFDYADGISETRTVSEFGDQAGIATHAYNDAGSYMPTVSVTDTGNMQKQATVNVRVSQPSAPPVVLKPASGGSGGGSMGWLTILMVLGAVVCRWFRRYS